MNHVADENARERAEREERESTEEQRTVHSDFDQVRRDAAQPEGQTAAEQAGLENAIRSATPDTPESRDAARAAETTDR